jgi:peptide/nickel transport system permease protein
VSDAPLPGDEGHESIPLLLQRTTRVPLAPITPRSRSALPATAAPPLAGVRWAPPRTTTGRLGAAGLLVAALLVLVSIFADLLASDLPVVCRVHGKLFVLPNVTHPIELTSMDRTTRLRETSWSLDPLVGEGPLATRADDPSASAAVLATPSWHHPLGTDREGRDVFARIVHGTRTYLVFALAAVAASLALGALLGAIAGLFGGATDGLVSRAIESVSAFPPLVLVIGVQAAVPRPTVLTLFLAIALTRWPEVARLVRGEVLLATTRDYVLAARALGASPLRVLRRHITPNVRGPLVVAAALGVSAVVLTEASLDFLRVGPPAGAASWGETMSEFRDAPHAWWLLAFPGVLLVATVVSYNLLGEAIRDAFDPRTR